MNSKGSINFNKKIQGTLLKAGRPSRKDAILEGLIIFTRFPEADKTKTRLITALGAEGAAELQRCMTNHVVGRLRRLKRTRPVSIEICHEGGDEDGMREWLGPDLFYRPQGRGGLGERMDRAMGETLGFGASRAVLVGSDCPGITERLIHEAFDSLARNDLVLGPAIDGGYYLIGLRKMIPELFVGIPWGSDKVLARTREVAQGLGLSVYVLETLGDVDRPEDLPLWKKASQGTPTAPGSPLLSIIIPTLNEAEIIAQTLASVEPASRVEVIVADGGSTDGTIEIARSHGARVLITAPGRAGQLNAGAETAQGEVLLFLHADTRLPRRFDRYVFEALALPGTVVGAFELRIDGHMMGLRFIERVSNWRSKLFGLPYGDQAIFLNAGLFRWVDGFLDMPIMEDWELMRCLRRYGRVAIAPVPVLTSGRRWEEIGVWQSTVINYAIPFAYYMGVSPHLLRRWYRHGRKRL